MIFKVMRQHSKAFLFFFILTLTIGIGTPFLSAAAQTGEPALPLDEYWKQVEATRVAVMHLTTATPENIRVGLSAWADTWQSTTQVELPDGSAFPVDNSELVNLLRQQSPDLPRILGRLNTLEAARNDFPLNKYSQKDLESLAKILAGPKFQWARAQQPPTWWAKLVQRIRDFLSKLLSGLGFELPGGGTVLTWILGILLAAVVIYLAWGLIGGLVSEEKIPENGEWGEAGLTSATALQRAQTLSGEGNYRNAVRFLYLSALLLLDERGFLTYDRSRTNLEYLRSLTDTAALAKPLKAVIDLFDRVWYGYESINAATYQDYVEHVNELKRYEP